MERKNRRIEFTKEEIEQRMHAALRGARISGPKPMKSMTPKRAGAQQSKRKKSKTSSA